MYCFFVCLFLNTDLLPCIQIAISELLCKYKVGIYIKCVQNKSYTNCRNYYYISSLCRTWVHMCLPVLLVALQSVPSSHHRSLWRRERRTYGDGDSLAKQEHLRDKDISHNHCCRQPNKWVKLQRMLSLLLTHLCTNVE